MTTKKLQSFLKSVPHKVCKVALAWVLATSGLPLSACNAKSDAGVIPLQQTFYDNNETGLDDAFEKCVPYSEEKIMEMQNLERYIELDEQLKSLVDNVEFNKNKDTIEHLISTGSISNHLDSPEEIDAKIKAYNDAEDKDQKDNIGSELVIQFYLLNKYLKNSYNTVINFGLDLAKASVADAANLKDISGLKVSPIFDGSKHEVHPSYSITGGYDSYSAKRDTPIYAVIDNVFICQDAESYKNDSASDMDYNQYRNDTLQEAIESYKLALMYDYDLDENKYITPNEDSRKSL